MCDIVKSTCDKSSNVKDTSSYVCAYGAMVNIYTKMRNILKFLILSGSV